MPGKYEQDRVFIMQHATAYAEREARRHDIPQDCCKDFALWYFELIEATTDVSEQWPGYDSVFPEWLKTCPVELF